METWTSVLVSLATLQTLVRARLPSSGISVAVRLLLHPRHRHHPRHPRLPLLRTLLHPLRRRLRPLPTFPLRPLLRRHQPLRPLHRLRVLHLLPPLRPAAAQPHPQALLTSPRLLRRREARTTSLLNRRLRSRTSPTWVRLLSTSGQWFAPVVDLVLKGRYIAGLSCTDGRRPNSCSLRVPISCHSFATYRSFNIDFSGLPGGRFLW